MSVPETESLSFSLQRHQNDSPKDAWDSEESNAAAIKCSMTITH